MSRTSSSVTQPDSSAIDAGAASAVPGTSRPVTLSRHRLAVLFAVILATSVIAFGLALVSYLRPMGDGDGLPGYSDVAPMRGFAWTFFVVSGVQLVIGVCAAALAGWILTPARGSRWGTVGGAMIWLGAAVYAVGVGGWATIYYYATDPTVLDRRTGTALVNHINHDTARMLGFPISGAVVVLLGSFVLLVGLWRAGSVPRWVVVLNVLAGVVTTVIAPGTPVGVIAEGLSSIGTIMIGWYVWKPFCPKTLR
jgi:hypothetical protein